MKKTRYELYKEYREVIIDYENLVDIKYANSLKGKKLKVIKDNDTLQDASKSMGCDDKSMYRHLLNIKYDIDKKLNGKTPKPKPKTKAETKPKPKAETKPKAKAPETEYKDTPKMSQYIPKHDGYISRRMAGSNDVKILTDIYNTRNESTKPFALLIGETGCGKTHLARHIAYKMKLPYMRVNMNGATTPEDLVGQFVPNDSENTNNKYKWQDGHLTTFMRHGGIFVVDEINMANADILAILNSVCDDERRLILTQKDGEVIEAHKDFFLIATMNPDYEGTKPLNIALKNRFRIITMDYNTTVEKKLKIDEDIMTFAQQVRSSLDIETPLSTRDLIQFTQDRKNFGNKIAEYFFINNFEEDEKKSVKEVISLVLNDDGDDNGGDSDD